MLSEEIKNLVGQVFASSVFEVEKESIRRFADAVGDMNPLYRDAEYAGKSRYDSIITPPGFISSVWYWGGSSETTGKELPGMFGLIQSLADAGYKSTIDSAIDYEFLEPIYAGDVIRSESVIKDMKERKSEDGGVVFLITDTTYTKENGNIAAKVRWTTIHR
ncbi:MaoC family dehydratase N-terminal domain-containing protein [Chloroflexota bacterium]